MARERSMHNREQRTLELLKERGAITAGELAPDLGMDRYRAYVWLRSVAGLGLLHQSPDGAFSLSCPLPAARPVAAPENAPAAELRLTAA